MIQLSLIGIGTGNPDHVTLAAVNAMNRADLILIPRKGETKSDRTRRITLPMSTTGIRPYPMCGAI